MLGIPSNPIIEKKWQSVLKMIETAPDDESLGSIAAGPLEDLLSEHGEQLIARVEQQAARDHQFARTLTNVWQWGMSDEVYGRIRALCARVKPLNLRKVTQEEIGELERAMRKMLQGMAELSTSIVPLNSKHSDNEK